MEKKAKIYYFSLPDEMHREEKLDWFNTHKFQNVDFERILPDAKANWINLTDNDFDTLIPLCSKEVKVGKGNTEAIFELFSNGIVTARDEWVYDFSKDNLEQKVKFFVEQYNDLLAKNDRSWNSVIKWSETLKSGFTAKKKLSFNSDLVVKSQYRPFSSCFYYADKQLSDRLTQNHYDMFGERLDINNKVICFRCVSAEELVILSSNNAFDLGYLKMGNGGTVGIPLYRYEAGKPIENITDWALDLFRAHYGSPLTPEGGTKKKEKTPPSGAGGASITKQDIFHYVYAVLHNPAYRTKYEQNLKRDFPRMPLYDDFWFWASAGKRLIDLHLHYETVSPYPLLEMETNPTNTEKPASKQKTKTKENQLTISPSQHFTSKVKLKAIKEPHPDTMCHIIIDEATTLIGIPPEAWEYKLGNRSALEWVLDQYKESTPSDATIAERFNTYRFADYKEEVINLLARVCTVSMETMRIISTLSVGH